MARYGFVCDREQKEFEAYHPMGEAPFWERCDCGHVARRIFTANFQEDRLRFYRARPTALGGTPPSERFSHALGQDMPDNRRDLETIAKAKGVEFISKRELPADWQRAREYKTHIQSGGQAVDPKTFAPPPPSFKGEIRKKMHERGLKFG